MHSAAWRISLWATLAFACGTMVVFVFLQSFVAADIQRRSDAWLSGEIETLGDVAERTPKNALYDAVVGEVAELAEREIPDKPASESGSSDSVFFLQSGASDVGGGADTVLAQIAAETLGVSLDKIVITSGDTDVTPFDVGAYASSTTIISGGAVKKAAEKVRAQVLEIAARMLDAPVESLDCAGNEVFTAGADRRSVTMSEIAMCAMYKEKVQIMDGASHFNTDSPPPFCATFAEVEVDTGTGEVHVLHLATAVDPGTAVNPMQAEGQVEGAVAQGLGFALTEELLLDEAGRPLNPNFLDYKIYSAKDMPRLTTILVETGAPLGPFGAKSISEVPINGVAPAIANAIYHAVGVRIRKLPIRPEDVLAALDERKEVEVMAST